MPRIGAYVPDALWESVRRRYPSLGTSALVQAALVDLLDKESPYLPDDQMAVIDKVISQARERLAKELGAL